MAIGQKNVVDIRPETFQQPMAEQGLACSRFAGQQSNAFEIKDGGQKGCQGAFVAGGGIIIIAVRRGCKRPAFQAEMRLIHYEPPPSPMPPVGRHSFFRIGIAGSRT